MNTFNKALEHKLISDFYNNYGIENYDEYRFGKFYQNKISLVQKIKNEVKRIIQYKVKDRVQPLLANIEEYEEHLQKIWGILGHEDRDLLVSIIAYRLLGFEKVKLPTNNAFFLEALNTSKRLGNPNDTYDPHFIHYILEKFDLNPIGFDIKFYFTQLGVAIDFIIEQYAYKKNNSNYIQVESSDIVLDIGGCWGDTALYFAHKTGKNGKVYSFEFIPDNIKLHNINTSLNPVLKSHIELIPHPVSDVSDVNIYYKDNGPGSRIEMQPFEDQTGSTTTITIDDFVKRNNIQKVDYIKMDIEGAEPLALKGAIETIKKFKPKLAIAIYHSMDDMVNIPLWIHNLNLDYELFLGHYTIYGEETICFAKLKN